MQGLPRLLISHVVASYLVGIVMVTTLIACTNDVEIGDLLGPLAAAPFTTPLALAASLPATFLELADPPLPQADPFPLVLAALIWSAYLGSIIPMYRWLGRKEQRRRQQRLLAAGLCPTCQYNLTGNTSGTCPECGTPIPSRGEA